MCGIFGYVGKQNNAAQSTLDGLKLLEYRGYDSWGIAVKVDKKIRLDKRVGKIGDATIDLPASNMAIGHTRWATHGGVTVENAHPHLDCKKELAVIHNGIVENFLDLKEELIKGGHIFLSETDTEVISHLIEEYMMEEGFSTAVRKAFNKLSGMNAVVALSATSKEIVAIKSGSPLVVGRAENGLYVASDVTGIIKHTREILFLEDNDMVILGDTVKLFRLPEGSEISPVFQTIDWVFEEADKGAFKHFIEKEIHDQPRVISNIALTYDAEVNRFSSLIDKAYGTFMLGCGTASYAALFGTYLFSKIAKKHINFAVASEFNYLEDYLTPKSLLIPISQSGETIDVVEMVTNAKKRGAQIAAVVNVLGSTIYRQANSAVLLGAGPERAVIATKSFSAMASVLFLTAYALANRLEEGKKILQETAKNVENILKDEIKNQIKDLAAKLKNKEHIFIIGRGISYAAAMEATLKIKETTYIHAEGFAGGELKHGVIALIEKGTPCIVFASNDETFDAIISNAQEVKARGGFIVGIGPKSNSVFDTFIATADVNEATIIPQVVVSQLLAYYLALELGMTDPDKPRNLAKSVTVK